MLSVSSGLHVPPHIFATVSVGRTPTTIQTHLVQFRIKTIDGGKNTIIPTRLVCRHFYPTDLGFRSISPPCCTNLRVQLLSLSPMAQTLTRNVTTLLYPNKWLPAHWANPIGWSNAKARLRNEYHCLENCAATVSVVCLRCGWRPVL
jgi:hypothetical protein